MNDEKDFISARELTEAIKNGKYPELKALAEEVDINSLVLKCRFLGLDREETIKRLRDTVKFLKK